MYSSTLIGVRDSYLLEELWSILPEHIWAPFLTFLGDPPPEIKELRLQWYYDINILLRKRRKTWNYALTDLKRWRGLYMNRFSREKHYSLINCIIYFLLIFSCDRCVHSEEIGAYSFSLIPRSVCLQCFHILINN
jgi:hypothetical protein